MPGRRAALALALAVLGASGCAPDAGAPAEAPNAVLVVIDTLRADRVGCYGAERDLTPHLDALCRRGIRFARARSTSSWTVPAHASLFTGLPPIGHGATQESPRLSARPDTLAELLSARGVATLGVSANPMVSRDTGLARGFDRFVESWRPGAAGRERHRGLHPNLAAVRALLEERPPRRPFFLFVNFIEPHGPYAPPEPHRSRFLRPGTDPARVRSALARRGPADHYLRGAISEAEFAVLNDLYDGEVARADALLGQLLDELARAGVQGRTALFLTSDHGESIGHHDHFRHVFQLYGDTVRVPLVVTLPEDARAGEVRPELVTLADLFATLLSWFGATPPAGRGRDLLADGLVAAPAFAEYYEPGQALDAFPEDARAALAPYRRRLRAVEAEGWKLIVASDGERRLYDLRRDPGETANRAGDPDAAERARALAERLEAWVAAAGGEPPRPGREPAPPPALDPESRERLRDLGYLHDE